MCFWRCVSLFFTAVAFFSSFGMFATLASDNWAAFSIAFGVFALAALAVIGIEILLCLMLITMHLDRAEKRELDAIAVAQQKKVEIPDPDAPPKGLPLRPAKFPSPPAEKPAAPPQRKSTSRPQ